MPTFRFRFLSLLAAALVACGGREGSAAAGTADTAARVADTAGRIIMPPGSPLTGTWRLVTLYDKPVDSTALPKPASLRFSNGTKATGSGGCNQIGAMFSATDSTLSFGKIISTKMACTNGMETETTFLRALGETQSYRITGDTLELRAGYSTVARLLRQQSANR